MSFCREKMQGGMKMMKKLSSKKIWDNWKRHHGSRLEHGGNETTLCLLISEQSGRRGSNLFSMFDFWESYLYRLAFWFFLLFPKNQGQENRWFHGKHKADTTSGIVESEFLLFLAWDGVTEIFKYMHTYMYTCTDHAE